MNTETKIRKHLTSGKSLTTLQALRLYRTVRLPEFVRRLRVKGMQISMVRIQTPDKRWYGKYSTK